MESNPVIFTSRTHATSTEKRKWSCNCIRFGLHPTYMFCWFRKNVDVYCCKVSWLVKIPQVVLFIIKLICTLISVRTEVLGIPGKPGKFLFFLIMHDGFRLKKAQNSQQKKYLKGLKGEKCYFRSVVCSLLFQAEVVRRILVHL